MNFEFAFKTLWGVATAAGWFWVNGLSAKLRAAEQDREALRERIHNIELNYQSKNDTKNNRTFKPGKKRIIHFQRLLF